MATEPLPIGKYNLELNFPGDGRVFLNHWDWAHGNDVVVEIRGEELIRTTYPPGGSEIQEVMDFPRFIELVIESINKRTV